MNVCVDSNDLRDLLDKLTECRMRINNASLSICCYNDSLHNYLEGNQYNLSVENVRNTCLKMEDICNNIDKIRVYLNNLAKYIDEYNNCKYNGD